MASPENPEIRREPVTVERIEKTAPESQTEALFHEALKTTMGSYRKMRGADGAEEFSLRQLRRLRTLAEKRKTPEAVRLVESISDAMAEVSANMRFGRTLSFDYETFRRNPESFGKSLESLAPKDLRKQILEISTDPDTPEGKLANDPEFARVLDAALRKNAAEYPVFNLVKDLPKYREGHTFFDILSVLAIERYDVTGKDFETVLDCFRKDDSEGVRTWYDAGRFGEDFRSQAIFERLGISDVLAKDRTKHFSERCRKAPEGSVLATVMKHSDLMARSFLLSGIPENELEKLLGQLPQFETAMASGSKNWQNSIDPSGSVDRNWKVRFFQSMMGMLALAHDPRAEKFRKAVDFFSSKGEILELRKQEVSFRVIRNAFPNASEEELQKKNAEFERFMRDPKVFDADGIIQIGASDLKKRLGDIFQGSDVAKRIEQGKDGKAVLELLLEARKDIRDAQNAAAADAGINVDTMKFGNDSKKQGEFFQYLASPSVPTDQKLRKAKELGIITAIPENPEEKDALIAKMLAAVQGQRNLSQTERHAHDPESAALFDRYWKGEIGAEEMREGIKKRDEEIAKDSKKPMEGGEKKLQEAPSKAENPFSQPLESLPVGESVNISEGYSYVRTKDGIEFVTPQGNARFEGKAAEPARKAVETLHEIGADFLISSIQDLMGNTVQLNDGTFTGQEECALLNRMGGLFRLGLDASETDPKGLVADFKAAVSAKGKTLTAIARDDLGILKDFDLDKRKFRSLVRK